MWHVLLFRKCSFIAVDVSFRSKTAKLNSNIQWILTACSRTRRRLIRIIWVLCLHLFPECVCLCCNCLWFLFAGHTNVFGELSAETDVSVDATVRKWLWADISGRGKNSLNPGVLSEPIRRLLENHVSPWLVSTLNISFYIKSRSAMFNAKSQWDFNYSAPLNTDGTKVLPFF